MCNDVCNSKCIKPVPNAFNSLTRAFARSEEARQTTMAAHNVDVARRRGVQHKVGDLNNQSPAVSTSKHGHRLLPLCECKKFWRVRRSFAVISAAVPLSPVNVRKETKMIETFINWRPAVCLSQSILAAVPHVSPVLSCTLGHAYYKPDAQPENTAPNIHPPTPEKLHSITDQTAKFIRTG